MWWLILLFNKIRFENKINIEIWGSFEILESYVWDRVNKIRFVGSINKEIRFRGLSVRAFWKRGEKNQRRRKE